MRGTWVGKLAAWFLAVQSILATGARAADVEIEHMTSPELRDRIAAGATTVIIPTGGTEQNGPHMVLGKHNFIVAETARRIATRLGNAVVAPVLAYVPEGDIAKREGHMAYAGTISVSPAVFSAVLEEAARSFRAHGFKTIVFLGDSGPNQAPQHDLAAKLQSEWAGEGIRVINCDDYYARNGGAEWLKSQGETDAAIGTHAAIRDTSELMAVDAAAVHAERAVTDKDGVVGDATRASAERGRKLLDLKVDTAVGEIEKAMSMPPVSAPVGGAAGHEDGLLKRLWRRIFG